MHDFFYKKNKNKNKTYINFAVIEIILFNYSCLENFGFEQLLLSVSVRYLCIEMLICSIWGTKKFHVKNIHSVHIEPICCFLLLWLLDHKILQKTEEISIEELINMKKTVLIFNPGSIVISSYMQQLNDFCIFVYT